MNCELYRLLDCYRRGGSASPAGLSSDLTAEDLAALERHQSECPACRTRTIHQNAFDQAVAAAIKAVPAPPSQAVEQLTRRLQARQRRARQRKFLSRLAVAATVLILLGLGYGVRHAARPSFDTDAFVWQRDQEFQDPESAVRAWLSSEGLPPELPAPFDFRLCRAFGVMPIGNGQHAPAIEFRFLDPRSGREEIARLYLLSAKQFQFRRLDPARSSYFTTQILRDDREHSGLVYLLLLSTDQLQPFLKPGSRNWM
jgi:hypothetical protein